MKLVEELRGIRPNYLIITGDGRTELNILREIPKKYNGQELILFFPYPPIPRKTGLAALDAVKHYPSLYNFDSIIFIVDGDTFKNDPETEIQDYLTKIGIEIIDITPLRDAFCINCKFGAFNIVLYCIISGPETFIEEEISELIRLTLKIDIDLSGKRDIAWKERVKNELNQALRNKKIKLKQLINQSEIENIEIAFPNLCIVLKKIEEDFHKIK